MITLSRFSFCIVWQRACAVSMVCTWNLSTQQVYGRHHFHERRFWCETKTRICTDWSQKQWNRICPACALSTTALSRYSRSIIHIVNTNIPGTVAVDAILDGGAGAAAGGMFSVTFLSLSSENRWVTCACSRFRCIIFVVGVCLIAFQAAAFRVRGYSWGQRGVCWLRHVSDQCAKYNPTGFKVRRACRFVPTLCLTREEYCPDCFWHQYRRNTAFKKSSLPLLAKRSNFFSTLCRVLHTWASRGKARPVWNTRNMRFQ